jgi:phytanoyl-CoA hydroxylase
MADISFAERLPSLAGAKDGYRSKFGGLWIDRDDWERLLEKKIRAEHISSETAEKLRFWRAHGHVILDRAVPNGDIDELRADIDRAWRQKDDRYSVQIAHGRYIPLSKADRTQPLVKLLDVYAHSDAAKRVTFADPIRNFLAAVFERDILAFQNLTFEVGSTQAVHQDTAYVVVGSPLELVASWVALEDIQEGSGELVYYPGSHNFPDFIFDGRYKHWDPERDGKEVHDLFLATLHKEAKKRGLILEKFWPKKGDVLIWSADLAHGGGPITRPGATRSSYVTHYCPNDVDPHYFTYLPHRRVKIQVAPGCYVSSSHYDLR